MAKSSLSEEFASFGSAGFKRRDGFVVRQDRINVCLRLELHDSFTAVDRSPDGEAAPRGPLRSQGR